MIYSRMVNSGGVNSVVLRVRAEKLDGARLEFVVHQSDQAIAVACDIKNHAVMVKKNPA